jgi:hypothetical protein
MIHLQLFLLTIGFDVTGVCFGLFLEPPDERDSVFAVEDTTNLFQR